MENNKNSSKNLGNWIQSNQYQSIIIDVSTIKTKESIRLIEDCLEENKNLVKSDGTLWIICKNYIEDNHINRLIPTPFIIADYLLSKKKLKLKNIIIWPDFKNFKQSNIFLDVVYYILFFTKSNNYHFNIDPVREKHIWKDVEWGKRKKNYHEKGKNPGNVWLKTEDDGKGKVIGHIPLSYTQMLERIIKCSSKKYFSVLLNNIAEQKSISIEGVNLIYEK